MPVFRTLGIDPEALFTARGNRIEKTYSFDVTAVTTVAVVGYHDVVERAFLRATP